VQNVNNKRIAKNTIIINIRLFVTIIVGLFTTRYVLEALGASNFGLYSVLAGVLSMITFISSSMSATTTRYINFEMGKKDENINRIFNVSLVIHIFMAIFILILAETIGIYYIYNYLNVEIGRENDAMFVFQVSIIAACVGIIYAPYRGLLVAKEKFAIMAKVEIFNVFLKLLLVLSLFLFQNNILRIYSVYMSLMTAMIFVSYHWLCYKHWPSMVKWNTKNTKNYYREILTFNNYNLLGASALMIRDQGVNVLINVFFGTAVNAAYAIARSVQIYVNNFMANIDLAAGPQITQSLSIGDNSRSEYLAIKVGKIGILLAMIAVFPLLVEIEFILQLWLGNVPKGTALFCQLTLALVLVGATSAGLTQIINGAGKIKWFKIQFFVLYVMCIPFSFYAYKQGASPVIAIAIFTIADILSRIIQLILLNRIVGFNSYKFVKEAYARPLYILVLMVGFILTMQTIMPDNEVYKIINIIITFCMVAFLSISLGLKVGERNVIIKFIRNRIHR
jgi:O-antigen/teichoic acid export membrane protein